MDPIYLPSGITLKDPSRYLGSESHLILRTWRIRQQQGEIPFKFDCYVGKDKQLEDAEYTDGLFDGLRAPRGPASNDLTDPAQGDEEDDQSNEDEHPRNGRKVLASDEEGSESDERGSEPAADNSGERDQIANNHGEDGEETNYQAVKRTRPQRRILSSDEEAHGHPLTERITRCQAPAHHSFIQRQGMLTPESSQTPPPVATEGTRQLHPRTKAAAVKEPTVAMGQKDRSKGKTKEGSSKHSGNRKRAT